MTPEKRYFLNFNSNNHLLEEGIPPYKDRLSILDQVCMDPENNSTTKFAWTLVNLSKYDIW